MKKILAFDISVLIEDGVTTKVHSERQKLERPYNYPIIQDTVFLFSRLQVVSVCGERGDEDKSAE